jgi:hypothetical protein
MPHTCGREREGTETPDVDNSLIADKHVESLLSGFTGFNASRGR